MKYTNPSPICFKFSSVCGMESVIVFANNSLKFSVLHWVPRVVYHREPIYNSQAHSYICRNIHSLIRDCKSSLTISRSICSAKTLTKKKNYKHTVTVAKQKMCKSGASLNAKTKFNECVLEYIYCLVNWCCLLYKSVAFLNCKITHLNIHVVFLVSPCMQCTT